MSSDAIRERFREWADLTDITPSRIFVGRDGRAPDAHEVFVIASPEGEPQRCYRVRFVFEELEVEDPTKPLTEAPLKPEDWSCVCDEGTYEPIEDCKQCHMGLRRCTACGDYNWDPSISKVVIR